MEHQLSPRPQRPDSPKPNMQRQRSNSFPIVEALGCSTPEAQLILAEGRAAVRKRRARRRQNRSVNDEPDTVYNPREHLQYLEGLSGPTHQTEHKLAHAKSCHARISSNTTDQSASTIRPQMAEGEAQSEPAITSPLGDYSANLAQFIKAQLRAIPTYQSGNEAVSPLSPQSCPDFTFPERAPSSSSNKSSRRHLDAPKVIEIPTIRPPARSAFSAWSSTDDETDDEAPPLPDDERYNKASVSKGSNYTPSILGFYGSNNSSFLFTSTPLDEEDEPDTAKQPTFPNHSALPGSTSDTPADADDEGYPSSHLSQPQLSTSSVPSFSSSAASITSASYFDCKRPMSITNDLKDRIIAALTPPIPHGKVVSAISPWEGAALTNVHDLYVESSQRVHVDGMSFDMIRDFAPPAGLSTPC